MHKGTSWCFVKTEISERSLILLERVSQLKRTIIRRINLSILAVCAIVASMLIAPPSVLASDTASGWSFFSTGDWEMEIPWPNYDDTDVKAATSVRGIIAEGKTHATPYYVYDSGVPGPTVALVGGMHGNEIAGYQAARTFDNLAVKKGRVIVIPELNRPAVRAKKRTSSLGDLNRDFPRTKTGSSNNYLATAIMKLMKRYKVNWLIDMHEGYDFHKINSSSVGQSVIYYPNSGAATMAKAMAAAASRTVSKSSHAFSTLKYPVSGSLARAVSIQLGAKGMICETSNKQPLSLRIKQHQIVAETMLKRLGMI